MHLFNSWLDGEQEKYPDALKIAEAMLGLKQINLIKKQITGLSYIFRDSVKPWKNWCMLIYTLI